ncbi:hypothetical protein ACHAXR_000199, partial [Thalassiosira sp. AJA248-18]
MPKCAACGKGACGTNQLKTCAGCERTQYCSVACQLAHRPIHKAECNLRAAELNWERKFPLVTPPDEVLFLQPPPAKDDCPICLLPMPLGESKCLYSPCCGKFICLGCFEATLLAALSSNNKTLSL